MTYKIVRDAQGEPVAFGPNDGMYEPTIKAGEILSIEDTIPATYFEAQEVTEANRLATITAAREHAASLGFTEAMLAVMYPQLTEAPSE